jgi:acetyl esterase/lipase
MGDRFLEGGAAQCLIAGLAPPFDGVMVPRQTATLHLPQSYGPRMTIYRCRRPLRLLLRCPISPTQATLFKRTHSSTNVLVAPNGDCDKRAALYAGGRDARDPLLSPVYGDMHGFPPAILTSGTRDLLLSSTVRVHRKLRQAGVESVLQVFEGQSHAQFLYDFNAPETKEAFDEIAQFFDKHLAR